MAHSLVDQAPEQMIAAINRRRQWKTIGVVGGLALAVVIMIAASAAMYSQEPGERTPGGEMP